MDGIFTDDELKAATVTEVAAEQQSEQQEQQTETQQETQAEQPRDEHGRFTAKEKTDSEEAQQETTEAKTDGKVPQGALHAERERRKGVEAQLKAAQEQLAAIAKLREQVASRKAPEVEAPKEDDNGVSHLTQRLQQLEQANHTTQQERDQQALQAAEDEQLGAIASAADAAYRQHVPDYDDAVKHLIQARAQELGYYGYGMPQIQRIIGEEARDIVRMAVQQGKDPADLAYQIAQARGYRKGAGTAETTTNAGQAQVEAIAKAKEQSTSLGQATGASPKQLNAQAILSMSPEEFEALYTTAEGRKMIDAIAAGSA